MVATALIISKLEHIYNILNNSILQYQVIVLVFKITIASNYWIITSIIV